MARNDFTEGFAAGAAEPNARIYARASFERLVVPFAMPLLIGPGAISAVIIYASEGKQFGLYGAAIGFGVIAAVFVYTTIDNIIERPDGVRIASLFILAIVVVSMLSRVSRAFELRASSIVLDTKAASFFADYAGRDVQLVAHDPEPEGQHSLAFKERQQRITNHIPAEDPIIFLEVTVTDASEFSSKLAVHGTIRNGRRVLEVSSPVVANSIAALLLHLRDEYRVKPNVYFGWTEGNPVANLLRFLFVGDGEIAPTTREVLRRAEPDKSVRPKVHVG
jgi:hypothetical protein